MELTREQELDVFLKTAIKSLKYSKNSKLGLQMIEWAEERQKLRFIEYCKFLLSNRLIQGFSLRDLRSEIVREIDEIECSIKLKQDLME